MSKVTCLKFASTSIDPQSESPLFCLPGEIRNQIWEYALTPYEDANRAYSASTCYARPGFTAPRTSAVGLLRACKSIYSEAWYLPWITAELCFYLTATARRPPYVETVPEVQRILNHLHEQGTDTSVRQVRVFAQLCELETGFHLQTILRMKHFRPREITVTIRHTDFWHWEIDEWLRVGGTWVQICRFPETVKVIRVEFESLERKKVQVDDIAQQAVERWEFAGANGVVYSAKRGEDEGGKAIGEMEVTRWTGGSTWGKRRWIRDETQPGKLDYYIKTVVWRVKEDKDDLPHSFESLRVTSGQKLTASIGYITEHELKTLGTKRVGSQDENKPMEELIEEVRRKRAHNMNWWHREWERNQESQDGEPGEGHGENEINYPIWLRRRLSASGLARQLRR
ncbi:hypothetical protein H072_1849 [Dactylellina haptotyla CBS 200.50]|uniref:Uncharacterized protein n=1 Tax=Dactylellina haptotyla (strain CBS 200.50) TaxID=1284197 RepID=S8AT88_DACHA|nr:hypothetical protein H072_1849 [Dactylellina haptotyla CBS 200.50]